MFLLPLAWGPYARFQPGQGVIPPEQADPNSPYDNSIILRDPPGQRKWGPAMAYHHWGESLYGYYVADDEWVIRRNAQLLADAGVDVIIFDVTNALHYHDIYMNLLRVYSDIRKAGGKTPAISFLTNTAHDQVVQALYRDLYSKGLYKDLWFYWKGKPLVMANPEGLSEELRDFLPSPFGSGPKTVTGINGSETAGCLALRPYPQGMAGMNPRISPSR